MSRQEQAAAVETVAEEDDAWVRRARPAFLYIMYGLLLWSVPMGLIAGVRPQMAAAIVEGMRAYLEALPEPLYALFGTGYLGYTAARAWGKAKGVER
ncbi:Holin of 3TMs, for gene-transfer release [Sphingobium faniae]|nr:Holin of 3TMs, for gene-transfer release [Sphingobium faniae]